MEPKDEVGSEESHRRLAYLPALDGVRAFAVVAVMMYHGGLGFATGGFMGVDTFFVLSGFLITSLLVGEWRESLTIRLRAFWARRARRLLPALFLMLLFVAFYASVIVPRGTYPALRLDSLATLFYVSNWHFILVSSNYFNETSSASPLIHTWSLAVEEQFYLVWPLVVLAVLHFARNLRWLLALSCAAAVASATWMYVLYQGAVNTNRVYLGTDTRAQCLFIGAALAVGLMLLTQREHQAGNLAQGELWRPPTARWRLVCGVLGLIGAGASVAIWVTTSTVSSFPYDGGFFLIGLATAGVILAVVGAPRSLVPRVLMASPIRYVGRISYGLYLWHWPLFLWVNGARTGLTGFSLFIVRALVTLVVSMASYHLVERPIRQGTFIRQARQAWVAVPTGVGVVVVALVAATFGSSVGISSAQTNNTTTTTTSHPGGTSVTTTPTTAPSGPAVRVLLFGDSVALTLGEGLGQPKVMNEFNYSLSDKGILGCGVVFGPEVELMGERDSTGSACNGTPYSPSEPLTSQPWPYQWLNAMAVTQPNVVVLLAGRWEVVDRLYEGKWTNILNPTYAAYVKHQLELAADLVTAAGSHMVFLTAPCTDEGEQPDGQPWPEDNPARIAVYNRLVKEVAAEHPDTESVVDLNAAVCPGGHYTSKIDGVTVRMSDGVHFVPVTAGEFLAPTLMPPILASGRAQANHQPNPASILTNLPGQGSPSSTSTSSSSP
ncbi:MAG TPA: acyltransferase family protein [Acidimicrobiales bacterium]|nr:acyltransferase family protein [Acidimicrobiales bacterium]